MGSNPTARAVKKRKVSKIKTYIKDTYNELLHNVTWPTWLELQNNTILVVVASVLLSLAIFAMDYTVGINKEGFWDGVLGWVYNKL